MGFADAITVCFAKYAVFAGRARRSEYWFFALFEALVNIVAGVIDNLVNSDWPSMLVSLGLLLPSLAVAVRRLHDIDRSGWWLLIGLIPVVGWIVLLIWACMKGTAGPNRFGPDPVFPAMRAPA
jgi:uncharacterized membrane protein YhaH (DUF805 family)